MKRNIYLLLGLLISLNACNSIKMMTKDEIHLINNGNADIAYRVLLTTNEKDLLFLRQKSIDVENVANIASDKEMQLFIRRLILTLDAEAGVGIAAPQVGLGRNIFLFLRVDTEDYPIQVAINPRIVSHSEETVCFEGDGCLSIPGQSGDTNRYTWVDVEYYDETGKLHKEKLAGTSRDGDFTGVIFQHEFDHLQGILFIDRLCE